MTSRKVTQEDIDYWCRLEVYPDGSVGQGSTDLKVGDDYPDYEEEVKELIYEIQDLYAKGLFNHCIFETKILMELSYEHQEKDKA